MFLSSAGVFSAEGAVQPVVGGHNGVDMALLHGGFEGGRVDIMQRALIDHGVGAVAVSYSWSLTARCLTLAMTPSPCTPLM